MFTEQKNSLTPQLKTRASKLPAIPRSIWALGLVSLFMDTSSELIHSLLPLFMVTTLGASMTAVGVVEGVAEATALIVKLFSGILSDYVHKRKLLTLIGYGLAALAKPLFALANTIGMVMAARFTDRIGKGIRDAPRDALMGALAPPEIRGACFGLRQSLDTIGAFLGPVLAIAGMFLFANAIRPVLWLAVIPALVACIILAWGVQEPKNNQETSPKASIKTGDIWIIGGAYWQLVALGGLLALARFSDAFLILKAQATGLPLALVPLVMVITNIIYALAAYPAGILSDRTNKKAMLVLGTCFLIAADLALGFTNNLWILALGIALWGLHMAFTQGLLAAMVTDTTPPALRGTAYGVFNLVSGFALLISSISAGVLWDRFGSPAAFFTGAACATLAIVALLSIKPNHEKKKS
jgi:MFS family permease